MTEGEGDQIDRKAAKSGEFLGAVGVACLWLRVMVQPHFGRRPRLPTRSKSVNIISYHSIDQSALD